MRCLHPTTFGGASKDNRRLHSGQPVTGSILCLLKIFLSFLFHGKKQQPIAKVHDNADCDLAAGRFRPPPAIFSRKMHSILITVRFMRWPSISRFTPPHATEEGPEALRRHRPRGTRDQRMPASNSMEQPRRKQPAASKTVTLLLGTVLTLLACVQLAASCNEMVCASIVSKCMLTQSCKCDMKSCTCCKECAECLSYLYTECCSCLEMCPKPNETSNELSKQSHIEDLEGFPNLYDVITSEQDAQGRWKVISFPIDIDAALYGPKADGGTKYVVHSTDMDLKQKYDDPNKVTVNCTVAYQAQCMSWNKCKESCRTMGASSYRWFHDGCCECIGQYCLNYGINESRCRDCPENKEHDLDDYAGEDELDYGDSMGPLDNSAIESTNI